MIEPVSPKEVREHYEQGKHIPDYVISAINALLLKKFSNGLKSNTFTQAEIIEAISESCPTVRGRKKGDISFRKMILDHHWLDFEPYYAAQGWVVKYDKPAYNESYEPLFTFSMKD